MKLTFIRSIFFFQTLFFSDQLFSKQPWQAPKFIDYETRNDNTQWSFYGMGVKRSGPHRESTIQKQYDFMDDVLCYTLHPDKWKSGYGSSGKGYFAGNHVGVMTCVQPNRKLEQKVERLETELKNTNAKLDKMVRLLEKIANKP